MNEFDKLYTVEDVARMTSFTSRTIRNYLKDGSLQGRKIGGQWRFTMGNIKRLFNNRGFSSDISKNNTQRILNFVNGNSPDMQGKIQVCTIIDYYCENPRAGQQIYEELVSAINSKDDDAPAKFNFDFMEEENKARFTLFGNPDYIIKTLQLL
ncbi:MAG: helix-turn-helix domain-containing protein [Dehalococcoidales bacterium]|jgi:hypothetical protein